MAMGMPAGRPSFAAHSGHRRPAGAEATQNGDTMLIYFSSGTTGLPKMVAHDFTYPLGHIVTAKFWQNVRDGGLHYTVADTGWAKSMWGKLYGQWIAGSDSPGKSCRYPGLPSRRSFVASQTSTVSPGWIVWPDFATAACTCSSVAAVFSGTCERSMQKPLV